MDPVAWKGNLSSFLSKYKYVFLVVLVGVILMLLPTGEGSAPVQDQLPVQSGTPDLAGELALILSKIQGVGKVEVLLTISEGEKTQYVYDEDYNTGTDTHSNRKDTVIISDGNRSDQGLVEQVIPPVYLGAVIVCQGGDNPTVRLSVVDAVSKATGLGSDRITVLKMK